MNTKHKTNKLIKNIKLITNNKDIDESSTQENTLGWDSLAYMSIVAMVEKEFEVEISFNNIKKFNSIKSILTIINNV
jgi:Acyl carrier protein|tara:strand:- start:25 stop:255 length:231 start_codon:yes stop_codon:yes gene_type:complete